MSYSPIIRSLTKLMEDNMTLNGYAHFADALVFVHGNLALTEAARHAELCEKSGDADTAAHWRKTMSLVRERVPQPTFLCS